MSGLADETDRKILALLRADARRGIPEIARLVNLSAAPVRRRIARLERSGVITGYTILEDRSKFGSELEALVELRFTGDTDFNDIVRFARRLPEVDAVLTIAGDIDAVIRVHVDNVDHLQQVVNTLRREAAGLLSTKTLIVMSAWRAGADTSEPAESADENE